MLTPVALIIFNRPDLTQRVFNEIAKAKPARLFIIADGPRSDRSGEAEKCRMARAIVDQVDWPCEIQKNYSEVNLGCGLRPSTGITWVFEHVDRAIILEDDVVPDSTFFPFCDELLDGYRDDERIMQICGHNYQLSPRVGEYSYYFSRRSICGGGWATWRRAWKHFDFEMKLWPTLRETSFVLDVLEDQSLAEKWTKTFDRAHSGKPSSSSAPTTDYWDYQWTFAVWCQSGLSICPNRALVSNVGYREDGTHTKSTDHLWANLPVAEMEFPLRHPPCIVRNREADHFYIALNKEITSPASDVHRFTRRLAELRTAIVGRILFSKSKSTAI